MVEQVQGDRAPGVQAGDVIVRVDPRSFRPAEVATLLGDPRLAKEQRGWMPEVTLDEMVREMVAHDLEQARSLALLRQHGYGVTLPKED